jgi:hypothetical protein
LAKSGAAPISRDNTRKGIAKKRDTREKAHIKIPYRHQSIPQSIPPRLADKISRRNFPEKQRSDK